MIKFGAETSCGCMCSCLQILSSRGIKVRVASRNQVPEEDHISKIMEDHAWEIREGRTFEVVLTWVTIDSQQLERARASPFASHSSPASRSLERSAMEQGQKAGPRQYQYHGYTLRKHTAQFGVVLDTGLVLIPTWPIQSVTSR